MGYVLQKFKNHRKRLLHLLELKCISGMHLLQIATKKTYLICLLIQTKIHALMFKVLIYSCIWIYNRFIYEQILIDL